MAAEQDDGYQATVAMAVAAAARVRELLWEMQRGADGVVPGTAGAAIPPATWNDKDREAVERARLEELRACVVDDTALQQLQRLPKRMCAYEFKPGDIAWNCKVCQVDETCVMCNECFIASDHENHEVFFYYTHSGGCCDCGDTEAWAPEGFCTQHRGAQDADPLALLPHRLVATARACLSEVLDLVLETITEARRSSILQMGDIEKVRARLARAPPDQRYSVLVHYNELQNSHEFASLLARALPSISYQTLKIVGEASAQKQSIVRAKGTRDEALDVAEALNRNGLVASVVPSDYKTKIPVVSTLLLWLVSLANLSDGVCRLICEQFISHHQRRRGSSSSSDSDIEIHSDGMEDDDDDEMSGAETEYPLLRAVILADSFLPKRASDALHSLLMALLADPVFKKSFAVAFTRCYRQLYREFVRGIGSSSVTILAFSVQFFNRASFVKLLVADHELLEVLVASVLETLRCKPRKALPARTTIPAVVPAQASSTHGSNTDGDASEGQSSATSSTFGDESQWSNLMEELKDVVSLTDVDLWDLVAVVLKRRKAEVMQGKRSDLTVGTLSGHRLELEAQAQSIQLRRRRTSPFLSLREDAELPGLVELDLASPVFVYRRYMSGLLDLRYALQIERVSERFVLENNSVHLAEFLRYLAYLQGACSETRRFGIHVEMESRAWVVTVEFVSTASDVFAWIISNVFKSIEGNNPTFGSTTSDLAGVTRSLTRTLMDAYMFWLASADKYFPPPEALASIGTALGPMPVDTPVSCHYPLHRTFAQLIRTLCDSHEALDVFYEIILPFGTKPPGDIDGVWVHGEKTAVGMWHRIQLIEPVLQAIVWDAEVHSGLWVRNGMSVTNHSMNYGEPPFCLRFRDLDLLLVQFGVPLIGMDWTVRSIVTRFGVERWYDITNTDFRDSELMVAECMALMCQFASELPPRLCDSSIPFSTPHGRGDQSDDSESRLRRLRSLAPYLRREIVQRLIVGPCAHSDLSKIATEFFLTHENLMPPNFSSASVLDQILREVCVPFATASPVMTASSAVFGEDDVNVGNTSGNNGNTGGKVQYRLRPELFAEYNPTFVHLTRKQHEAAHENWFQQRMRASKLKEQQQEDDSTHRDATHGSWLDFPLVNSFLPCAPGFRLTRLSVLHTEARRLVYESLWRASTDPHTSLNVVSRAVHLFTLQLYVVEDIRYAQSSEPVDPQSSSPIRRQLLQKFHDNASLLHDEFMEWTTLGQSSLYSVAEPRPSPFELLLRLNPWIPNGGNGANMVNLDGDQKHEVGRGVDWLVHRLARLSDKCRQALEQHLLTRRSSREEEDRKALMARKRKEAQMRAMQQMQARQAAFAEQMRAMLAGNPDGDDENGVDDESSVNGTMDDRADDDLSGIPRRRKSSKEFTAAARARMQSDAGCADDDVVMDESDEDEAESKTTLPECAMCHSVESENSFMCFVGFAQCSPVFSRLNGGTIGAVPGATSSASQNSSPGTASHNRYLSTPMDEMHVGEDVPVHVRLCGHSVHHTCWESYHASQFQRAITGGHHRHALNAVDVTKKEFLCPLCKSISNVLIPTVSPHGVAEMVAMSQDGSHDSTQVLGASHDDMLKWLDQIGRFEQQKANIEESTEQKTEQPSAPPSDSAVSRVVSPVLGPWLRDGLSSLCMAVHKVACGATQKSRPDRYTSSACLALFHTLLCTFIGAPERDGQLRPERRFFDAMRYIPLMLDEVAPVARGSARGLDVNMTTADVLRKRIAELLFFGGSVIMPDGTVVLEDEHPSTQTQTRKQSQWGKVRWPVKPLLLSQLGSVLTRGVLLAKSDRDAVFICRMIILARIIQTLLWYSLARHEDFTDAMIDDLEYSTENVQALLQVLVEDPAQRNETSATACLEAIRYQVMSSCGDVFEPRETDRKPTADGKLLNLVATEVIPMMRVATFLIQSRSTLGSRLHEPLKPTVVSNDAMLSMGFVPVDALAAQVRDQRSPSPLCQILARWVARFRDAYTEMNDPQGILQQWLTNANLHKPSPAAPASSPSSSLTSVQAVATAAPKRLTYSLVLTRDLNTVYTSMSVYASGANRTRYLRSLPRAYVKFYAELARRKCPSCHQFPARPAVCLVCGMLLCAANTCPSIQVDKGYPEESNPGACTVHAKKCGRGSCMFLLVLEGAVLLVYWKLAAYVGSLYVDEYGEEFGERNRELNKGRPLYLNTERRERLLRLWRCHEIPNEVVRIQNSSDRVIRNSHY